MFQVFTVLMDMNAITFVDSPYYKQISFISKFMAVGLFLSASDMELNIVYL